MKTPSRSHSAETIAREYGLYHLTRLKGDDDLAEPSDAFAKAQQSLKDRIAAHEAAREAALIAMAVRDGREVALDIAVRNVYLAVRSCVQTKRRSLIFQRYFPKGLWGILRRPSQAKLDGAGVVLAKLREETNERLVAELEPLERAIREMKGALGACQAAVAARVEAFGLVQAEKLEWIKAYKKSHWRLQIELVEDLRDAESFFRSFERRSSGNGDVGEEPVEEPAAVGDEVAELVRASASVVDEVAVPTRIDDVAEPVEELAPVGDEAAPAEIEEEVLAKAS